MGSNHKEHHDTTTQGDRTQSHPQSRIDSTITLRIERVTEMANVIWNCRLQRLHPRVDSGRGAGGEWVGDDADDDDDDVFDQRIDRSRRLEHAEKTYIRKEKRKRVHHKKKQRRWLEAVRLSSASRPHRPYRHGSPLCGGTLNVLNMNFMPSTFNVKKRTASCLAR